MAPFSIPAPCIIPLRIPVFGIKRSLDTDTLIELTCETALDHEIFYTIDGTKPQPYSGIVQGSKLHKYKSPFCLPAGKITIKAIAIHVPIHTMRSNVITKTYDVIKAEKKAVAKNKVSGVLAKSELSPSLNDGYNSHPHQNSNTDDVLLERLQSTFEVSLSDLSAGASDADEVTESLSECSLASEVELKVDKKDAGDMFRNDIFTDFEEVAGSVSQAVDLNRKIEEKDMPDESSLPYPCCVKCATVLVHCKNCNTASAITSKFCYQCGMRLFCACGKCNELNSMSALFCQACGNKMLSEEKEKVTEVSYMDSSIMVEPLMSHAAIQHSFNTMNKFSQTLRAQKDSKKATAILKSNRMPPHSPGKGYWRQQMDYVCNHLKSFAYNNMEFREAISMPILSDFRIAKVLKSSNEVTISVVFSKLDLDKDIDNRDMPSDTSS